MPIVQSKIRTGRLTLAVGAATPEDFAAQATAVRIAPTYNDAGDALETLSGDTLAADTTRADSLNITSIQDFDDADGFLAYLWANDLEEAAFVWDTGAAGVGVRFTGTVQLRVPETGGDVNARLTTDLELPVIGAIVGPVTVPGS